MSSSPLRIVDYMDDIHTWIEDNIDKKINLNVLSEQLGYSKRAIQLQFKKQYGISIGCYIQNRRLHRAAVMLRMTTLSVIDISNTLHYMSYHNFCRAFKKGFNITPTQFRKINIHEQPTIEFPKIFNERNIEFKIKNISNLIISGRERSYVDCIYNTGIAEEKLKWLQQYFLKNTKSITIASKFIPDSFSFRLRQNGGIKYSAVIDDITTKNEIAIQHTMVGLYLHCHFDGSLDGYREYTADIYRNLLPSHGLTQRYGRKIEVFHHVKDVAGHVFICCEQYIPITMRRL